MHENEDLLPFNIEEESEQTTSKSIIKVIGVGGGGGNAVENMFAEGIENVEFVIANTDVQVLENSDIPIRIQLGKTLTEGLGAGNNHEVGREAAKESAQEITDILSYGTKMTFITAGMGGGTGTGAAPVIAKISKELNILTIGIVTIPFEFEGDHRIEQALIGLQELKENVDALIIINNEKISEVYRDYSIPTAFKFADQVLTIATKGIAEIITNKGLINVDFADVKSVMKDSGVAVMGTGFGTGENRGEEAVQNAINSPLLNNNDISGAKHILVNIVSPSENTITTIEMYKMNKFLQSKAGNKANLIWGLTIDESMNKDECVVTVIATSFNDNIIPSLEDLLKKDDKKEIEEVQETDLSDTAENENIELELLEDEDTYEEQENSEDLLKEKIRNIKGGAFDFSDDNIVDKFDKEPAYIRNQLSIGFNDNNNNFLDPRID